MTSPEIQLNECSVQLGVEPHDEYPSFQKNLILEVLHPAHGKIASLAALHINRKASRCGGRFLEIMDEDEQELADFSRALFNKHGFLKRHLIDNPYLRGTGAWGREMDSGALIYISTITVDQKCRGRGVGSWVLQQLLGSVHVKEDDFLICWPAPLSSEINVTDERARSELWTRIHKSQIHFFQKNHFRRIGRTQFFALSPQNDHPSRSIPIDADAPGVSNEWAGADRLSPQSSALEGLSPFAAQQKDVELRHSRYPLHSAICELRGQHIAEKIQRAYSENPDSIHQCDDRGFTPVFTAAITKNIDALKKLIDLGVSEDLTNRDNADGLTPLEACTQMMVSSREFAETLLPRWDGFSREELLCCAAMKRAISPSTMTVTDEEYVARRKWGCTCGACLGGWLSPRMKIRLEYEGEIKFDMMDTLMDSIGFVSREPLAEDSFAPGLEFIPLHLRDQLYKSFYKGYRWAFQAITFVSQKNIIPYPLAVREVMLAGGFRGYDSNASTAINFYLNKGGLPDFALDCLLDAMEEQSPLGDGEFDLTFEDDLQKLPECANDLEFNLVRQNLGLDMESRGPYRDLESGLTMQGSGFDDEDSDEEYDAAMDDEEAFD